MEYRTEDIVKAALAKPLLKQVKNKFIYNPDLSRDEKIIKSMYCSFVLLHGEGQEFNKFMDYLELN